MGAAMATHLVHAGHDVVVWNRTPGRADALTRLGVREAADPADAAADAQIVVTCVSDSPDLEQVVLGARGAAQGMTAGAILVDHSTIAPATARSVAATLARAGIAAVDAPVSGGSEGARAGTLSAFVGGDDEAVTTASTAMSSYCGSITHLGPAGAGQAAKAVNQVLVAGTYAALGEALVLGEREGLPMQDLVRALSAGAARSWVLENRSANVIAGDYPLGFRIALHLKDLRIALDEAESLGIPLEITALIADQERRLVDAGHGDEDLSALARLPRGD